MGNDEHTSPLTAQRIHAVRHNPQRVNIKAAISFIHDDKARLEHHHLENLHTLFLAARKTNVKRTFQHFRLHFKRRRCGFRFLEKVHRTHLFFAAHFALRVHRGAKERHCRHARNFKRVLERQKQAFGRALFGVHIKQVFSAQRDIAARDLIAITARQHIRERRFTRAVRPHNRMNFTRRHLKRKPAKYSLLAVINSGR